MILPFSTQLNGKPTYFVEKIHACLESEKLLYRGENLETFDRRYFELFTQSPFDYINYFNEKKHTIREDKNNRWKEGTKIDFFINVRQPNMYRFAPVLPVVSIQEIEVNYVPTGKNLDLQPIVFIDKKFFYHNLISNDTSKMFLLAKNDGFDSIPAFFDYFNKNFKGKIIHWTDFKY